VRLDGIGRDRRGGVDDHLLRCSPSTFMASRLIFYLILFVSFSVNTLSLRRNAHVHVSCSDIACGRKGGQMGSNQFLQMYSCFTPPCFLSCGQNAEPNVSGVCFGSSYKILHLDFPDNPNQPCLSCTKQWCLNQNLPICAGATLGDANPDTATGREGDVEARCFREYSCSHPYSGGNALTTAASCD